MSIENEASARMSGMKYGGSNQCEMEDEQSQPSPTLLKSVKKRQQPPTVFGPHSKTFCAAAIVDKVRGIK
jgi:hypothetical protein